MRKNKTRKNLQQLWEQLDNASGELYEALFTLSLMTGIPEDIQKDAERLDITAIDNLKNKIEEILEQQKIGQA
jgi:hypothetical protein